MDGSVPACRPGQGFEFVLVRPAASVKVGMPSWTVCAAGGDLVHLGELGAGAGEADFESFGFPEPAVGFGLGDAGDEVVADLDQTWPGGGVGAQERAA